MLKDISRGKKIIPSLLWGSILLLFAFELIPDESSHLNGYTDIVRFRDKYIAIGADGRIANISIHGESVTIDHSSQSRLNCAFSNDNIFIAVGDHGSIVYSVDGKVFNQAKSGTDKNISGITSRNGLIVAGAENGTILTSRDGKVWNLSETKAKGNILSLSSNNSFFIGVTDAGEIIKSINGLKWEIKDYNKEYAGYNPYSKFRKILAVKNNIIIIGIHEDGSPSILTSSLGSVWAERLLVYFDEEDTINYLKNTPVDLTYDPDQDQFILACKNGELFTLPSCSKCNKLIKISESDLNAIVYDNNFLLVGDADYSVLIQRL